MLFRRATTVVFTSGALILASMGIVSARDKTERSSDEAKLNALWIDLEKEEATATRALLKLSAQPNDAVAFLKKTMKPLKIDEERVKGLLDWLASDDPKVWKFAFEELEYFDPRLAIDLETLMKDVNDAPGRQRMVELMSGRPAGQLEGKEVSLRGFRDPDGGFNFVTRPGGSFWAEDKVGRINVGFSNKKKKWTRAVRAIVLLEHLGTPDAVAILKDMASGHPEAQPTREAKEALERVAREPR